MKSPFIYLFIFISTLGCKKTSTLSFSEEFFTEKNLKICQNDPCSKIAIDYVKSNNDDEVSKAINSKIETYIIETLFLGEDDKPASKTIEEAAKQFILAYRDHKNEFEYDLQYEAEITITTVFENDYLLSLQFQNYLFLGGAHGYGSTTFVNFDKITGEELSTKKLFKNFEAFKALAENEFRQAFQIPNEESINYTGFWFDNDQFRLPETIGFSKKEIIVIYNHYEIASYAQGPIIFTIPIKEATPFLNNNYL